MPIGEKTKLLWADPVYREKMRAAHVGHVHSEEHKRKIGLQSRGRRHTEQSKKKLSIALAGNKNSVGAPNYWKGKKRSVLCPISDATKQRMREGQLGPNGSNWQGGKTAEIKRLRRGLPFTVWRKSVFTRDNWTCQRCEIRGGYLHPHHVLNFAEYPDLRFQLDNGITLCRECHNLFHRIYGLSSNTRPQLEEFLGRYEENKVA